MWSHEGMIAVFGIDPSVCLAAIPKYSEFLVSRYRVHIQYEGYRDTTTENRDILIYT